MREHNLSNSSLFSYPYQNACSGHIFQSSLPNVSFVLQLLLVQRIENTPSIRELIGPIVG